MNRETRTILIVEGSVAMLFDLGMLLRRLEYRVDTARSAEDALKKMQMVQPSIVLTEIALPGMSGINLVKRMKDNPLLKPVPVIVLTAEKDDRMRDACLGMGCAAFLAKPVDPAMLYRTIQSVSESIPRANIRIKTSLKVTVGDGTPMGGAERTESLLALSEGGMYVQTLYPQPQKAVTPVRIFLPDREIRAKAVVLYSYATAAGPYKEPGMGMKFVELSDADREAIRIFIKGQVTRDIMSFTKK